MSEDSGRQEFRAATLSSIPAAPPSAPPPGDYLRVLAENERLNANMTETHERANQMLAELREAKRIVRAYLRNDGTSIDALAAWAKKPI